MNQKVYFMLSCKINYKATVELKAETQTIMPPDKVARTSLSRESESLYLLRIPTTKVTTSDVDIEINLYHSGTKLTRMKTNTTYTTPDVIAPTATLSCLSFVKERIYSRILFITLVGFDKL